MMPEIVGGEVRGFLANRLGGALGFQEVNSNTGESFHPEERKAREMSPQLVSHQIKELANKVDNLRFSTNERLDEIANYVADEIFSMRDKA